MLTVFSPQILGPSAAPIWKMIQRFREHGSSDVADSLEAAAEKQAEAVLRTQQLVARTRPVAAVSREQTPPVSQLQGENIR